MAQEVLQWGIRLMAMLTLPITAAILYDFVHCPHRVALDAFGDPSERDAISPFVRLLWESSSAFEKEVVAGLKIPFLDLSRLEDTEREASTLQAMRNGEPLISMFSGDASSRSSLTACGSVRLTPRGISKR
jgi:hypothetical protein